MRRGGLQDRPAPVTDVPHGGHARREIHVAVPEHGVAVAAVTVLEVDLDDGRAQAPDLVRAVVVPLHGVGVDMGA